MEKILITGAYGYLGACIYEELRKTKSVIKLQGRLEDIKPDSIDCDLVVHSAGALRNRKGQHQSTNIEGTRKLLQGLSKKAKIVYVSSKSVYGIDLEGTLTEKTKPQPKDDYGKTKYEGELLILNSGLPYLIIRPSTLFGLGVNDLGISFPSYVLQQLFKGEDINLYSPDVKHEYLYVHDLSSIISDLLGQDTWNNIFNVSGSIRSLHSLINLIHSRVKTKTEAVGSIKTVSKNLVKNFYLDSSKIKKTIGGNIYTPDEIVIDKMVNFIIQTNQT